MLIASQRLVAMCSTSQTPELTCTIWFGRGARERDSCVKPMRARHAAALATSTGFRIESAGVILAVRKVVRIQFADRRGYQWATPRGSREPHQTHRHVKIPTSRLILKTKLTMSRMGMVGWWRMGLK